MAHNFGGLVGTFRFRVTSIMSLTLPTGLRWMLGTFEAGLYPGEFIRSDEILLT